MDRRFAFLAALVVVALIALLRIGSRPTTQDQRFASRTHDIMATPVTVLSPEPVADEAADIVFRIFHEVDAAMSEWKPDSPLTAVNRAAGIRPVEVPDDLRRVLRRGVEIGDLTGGAFDITWAALWGLWDFKAETPQLPGSAELEKRVALIDYRRIVIDDDAGTIYLPRPGMLIGLGGIAKGTALDQSADALLAQGIDSFLISAGGQVVVRGRRNDRAWRVGIRDPRGRIDEYFAHLELSDCSAATSGDYERFFMLDGVRYHHILDPRTGMPSRGLRSATVISADAELADALSTAMMILGLGESLALAERLDDVEFVLVDADNKVHLSPGLEGRLQIKHPPTP